MADNKTSGNRQYEIAKSGPCSLIALMLIGTGLLSSCTTLGYATEWDQKVKTLCQTDGGVTVYQKVKPTSEEYRYLTANGGAISVPPRSAAKAGAPFFSDNNRTWLNRDPDVFRSETSIVRASDGAVLSRLVNYARVGRDFVRPYGCRDVGIRLDLEQQTFEIPGG